MLEHRELRDYFYPGFNTKKLLYGSWSKVYVHFHVAQDGTLTIMYSKVGSTDNFERVNLRIIDP